MLCLVCLKNETDCVEVGRWEYDDLCGWCYVKATKEMSNDVCESASSGGNIGSEISRELLQLNVLELYCKALARE